MAFAFLIFFYPFGHTEYPASSDDVMGCCVDLDNNEDDTEECLGNY